MGGLLNKDKTKRTKRGKGGKKEKNLTLFSTNAAGLKLKLQSLKSELTNLDVGIFTIQETHAKKKGTFKVKDFEIFEAIRQKEKGGTMIGVQNALNPVLIKEYSDSFELLVVEFKVCGKEIRMISGYGPQECWNELDRIPFFLALEEEINKAEMLGKSIIIEMDANSKLGPGLIKSDPHPQSSNGFLLANIISRHSLVVLNGNDDLCDGTITRRRVTKNGVEESIIDFVLMSDDLLEHCESLLIDEKRDHILTKIIKTKKGVKKVVSDHNVLISKFKLVWRKTKNAKIETFNFKNKDCQRRFRELTSSTVSMSSIFDTKDDLNMATKHFIKRLNGFIHEAFRKVRISDRKNSELDKLFERRRVLRRKNDQESKEELERVEEELANKCAEENYAKIMEEIKGIDCNEGGVHS